MIVNAWFSTSNGQGFDTDDFDKGTLNKFSSYRMSVNAVFVLQLFFVIA